MKLTNYGVMYSPLLSSVTISHVHLIYSMVSAVSQEFFYFMICSFQRLGENSLRIHKQET